MNLNFGNLDQLWSLKVVIINIVSLGKVYNCRFKKLSDSLLSEIEKGIRKIRHIEKIKDLVINYNGFMSY